MHYHQYHDLAAPVVLDFSPVKDLLFADLNLSGADRDLFGAVYERTSGSLPAPDVVVFLDLDGDHLLDRIAARGREYERDFDPSYLQGLAGAYEGRFQELGQRVHRVRVSRKDPPAAVAAAVSALVHTT